MSATDRLIGKKISHYRVLERLGGGGMGVVYKAEDTRLKRPVALKFISSDVGRDAGLIERFQREAEAASVLNHPNICTIYDVGEQDGLAFIAMEFLDGKTLKDHIAGKPLPLEEILELSLQATDGLEAAHQAGIVHRDIKPANILVTKQGRVKILDFGLAKQARGLVDGTTLLEGDAAGAMETVLTMPGAMVGTVAYMSPEQVRGEPLDARTDIFSFGLVLYEMATGQQAFHGNTTGVVSEAILNRAPEPLRRIVKYDGLELERIVTKALEKDRARRYGTTSEFRADLLAYKQELDPSGSGRKRSSQISNIGSRFRETATNPAAWGRRKKILVGAGIAAALGIGADMYWSKTHAAVLTDKDTVVVAEFTNTTGEAIFDGSLRQGLASQLEQSPFLSIVGDDRIGETLQRMAQPKEARLTQQLAREACKRLGSKATIEGSISGLGGPYELQLRSVDCHTGSVLTQVNETAGGKKQVLEALNKAATRLRKKLGESLATVQKYDLPAENVTTSSLEALQLYGQGCRAADMDFDFKNALVFYDQAINHDPNFAAAYAKMASAYRNSGQMGKAAEAAQKAYELRSRVSERERYYIESSYALNVTGDSEAARQTLEDWEKAYPRDDVPPHNLAIVYGLLGEPEKMLAAMQRSLKLDPESGVGYGALVASYLHANRIDEAKALLQEAMAKHPDTLAYHNLLYALAFLERDSAAMEREANLLINNRAFENGILYMESETAAYGGQMGRARELAGRTIENLKRDGNKDGAGGYTAEAALREALVGNREQAKRQVDSALQLTDNAFTQATGAIVLALSGETEKATKIAGSLAERFPANTSMQQQYLPMVRAAIALGAGNGTKAVEAFAKVGKVEEGFPQYMSFLKMYPVYMHGLSCLAARQGAQAAVEFQEIIDHPGMVQNEPVGAWARLGLARALAETGETEKAKTAYQDFLAIWKDADPDVPMLNQAKTEYAKLKGSQ